MENKESFTTARAQPDSGRDIRNDRFTTFGRWSMNYSLAIIFVMFGSSKFAPMAGEALGPLISNSPLIFWLQDLFGVAGAAHALGVYEILTGLLIAARPINLRLSEAGGAMAMITFLITVSFLFSTPGVAGGNPLPLTMLGHFLLKDIVLLSVACWICASSHAEARAKMHDA